MTPWLPQKADITHDSQGNPFLSDVYKRQGYDAVATYTGTIQKPTGKTEYTVKAVATYEKEPTSEPEAQSQPNTGLTPIQIVLLSVAAFLLVVLVVGLLSILAKRRKKKEKEI